MTSKTITRLAILLLLPVLTPVTSAGEPDTRSLLKKDTNIAKELLNALSDLTPETPSQLQQQNVVPRTHFATTLELTHYYCADIKRIPIGSGSNGPQCIVATALANSGFKIDKAAYAEIGRAIKSNQDRSSEEAIEAFLNKFFRCVIHRKASHRLLVEHLRMGLPAIALMEGKPNNRHCVIVTGCTCLPDGTVTGWRFLENRKLRFDYAHTGFIERWRGSDVGPEAKNTCLLMYPKKGYKPPSKPIPKITKVSAER